MDRSREPATTGDPILRHRLARAFDSAWRAGPRQPPPPNQLVILLEDIVVSGTGRPPALWFASDGSASELKSMFSTPGVISDLAELKAGVALAVSDLSADRARIVQQLNQAGIPVTAHG